MEVGNEVMQRQIDSAIKSCKNTESIDHTWEVIMWLPYTHLKALVAQWRANPDFNHYGPTLTQMLVTMTNYGMTLRSKVDGLPVV